MKPNRRSHAMAAAACTCLAVAGVPPSHVTATEDGGGAAQASEASGDTEPRRFDVEPRRFDVELALFPVFTERQVEGPNRDDKLVSSPMLAVLLNGTYAFLDWLEAGLYLHFDVGSVRYARFSRPDAQGIATQTDIVEGSFWELWTAIFVRARLGAAFFELGWAPLMLRKDGARDDLPNESGETDGVFVGSRAVAFLLGVGGRIPLADRLHLTLRLEVRIRYLVDRGGEPLADDEEFGQMTAWPFVGLSYRF